MGLVAASPSRPGWLHRALAEHSALVAVTVGGALIWIGVAAGFGVPHAFRDLFLGETFRFLAAFVWIPLPFAYLACRLRVRTEAGAFLSGPRGWAAGWRLFRERYVSAERVAGAAVASLAICIVMNTYVSWKRAIPTLQPFSWDARFAELDRALHFGRDPWEWLTPMLRSAEATWVVDQLYFGYFVALVLMFAWQAWSADRQVRRRFFLSVALAWLLMGNWAATLFSSAGPCYYAHVVGTPDPFAPLFQRLAEIGDQRALAAPWLQDQVWRAHQAGMSAPYRGISAMPSMHVAITFLFALTGFARSRLTGVVTGGYAAVVVLGSVLLGWHYAIDAYASLLGAWLIWRLAGRLIAVRGIPPSVAGGAGMEEQDAKVFQQGTRLHRRQTVDGRPHPSRDTVQ
jgi:hypothetical protein